MKHTHREISVKQTLNEDEITVVYYEREFINKV